MIPKISKEQAKAFAIRIYEQIPQFCQVYEQEYIIFLSDRLHISENARQELERLTQTKK
ncbi:MAG: hypothetical protein PHW00_02450 [Clostridia bacterium]|nr:hypothetical protein [Clostridia bacterium]